LDDVKARGSFVFVVVVRRCPVIVFVVGFEFGVFRGRVKLPKVQLLFLSIFVQGF
jgi:hypothetical protein